MGLKSQKAKRSNLEAEFLEPRVLLTTLTLPADVQQETTFLYADPEENDSGSDVAVFNEVRIGTLSGMGPSKDVVVELLNYRGEDIPGDLVVDGQTIRIGGGPGGISIIDEVPSDVLGGLGASINALASNTNGDTFGITTGGFLVEVDRTLGVIDRLIGEVVDTDNAGAKGNDVIFTDFDAAAFDPVTGTLYAVVVGPTSFDGVGQVLTTGEVLISIDTITGEAEAIGVNNQGQTDYSLSGVSGPGDDILTIVHTGQNGIGEPIFLAYDNGVNGAGDVENQFLTISVVKADIGNSIGIFTAPRATVDDSDIVEGLMYDQFGRLFGLLHQAGSMDGGTLVTVDLDAAVADRFQDIVDFGDQPTGGADPPPIFLTGMSFDDTNNVGYATDPTSGTLYAINTEFIQEVDDQFVIVGGLSDIYLMYIASSTPDVYITITSLTIDSDGNRVYTPTGGTEALLFIDEDDASVSTPSGAGGVMIGTIPQTLEETQYWSPGQLSTVGTFFDDSEVAADPGPIGAYPGGGIRPGIIVAPDFEGKPQDIGRIQIGGGVFGDVSINGSIDLFYAGFLGTNDFVVDGDLNNLVVHTQAGGVSESDNSWTLAGSASYGGSGNSPVLDVQGNLGSVYGQGDWGLPILVHGASDAPQFPGVYDVFSEKYVRAYRELERKIDDNGDTVSFMSGAMDTSGGWILTNDTVAEAQYLGTIDGKISVLGETESSDWDTEDYYSFGVFAGQTLTINLYDAYGTFGASGHPLLPGTKVPAEANLTLIDPDGELVALLGEVDIVTGAPLELEYTAEKAGIYTVVAAADIIGSSNTNWIMSYRLEIEGVSETTFGGGNVLTDVRYGHLANYPRPTVEVLNGNMGAFSSGGAMRNVQIRVDDGSLGGLRAGFNGSVVGFNWDDDDGIVTLPDPSVFTAGDIGQVSSPVDSTINIEAGSQISSVKMGGSLSGLIVSNGNIGEVVIAGSFSDEMNHDSGTIISGQPTGIFANADEIGEPGVIDRIYVGGDFGLSVFSGSFGSGIPVSVGGRGGNVRFVDIQGSIVVNMSGYFGPFGPFEFAAGQSVTVTDDSGVLVKLSPGYTGEEDVDEFLFVTPPDDVTDPNATPNEGGVLTVQLLPIWDLSYADYIQSFGFYNQAVLGYVITEVTSTDGLRVTTTGGPAELGVLNVTGDQNNRVNITGNDEISVLQVNVDGAIEQIVNSTPGGDIVSIVIAEGTGFVEDPDDQGTTPADQGDEDVVTFPPGGQPFALISIDGHLGRTENSTGQIIETVEIAPIEDDVLRAIINPIGSQVSGLLSAVGIDRIVIGGSLGDTRITGDVDRITLNSDNSRAGGQFDGMDGALVIEGNLNRISLGDGIRHPGTGEWAQSGIFVTGVIVFAEAHDAGHDIGGPLFGSGGIVRVQVSNGARITGYNASGGTSERVRGSRYIADTISTTSMFDNYQLYNSSTGTVDPIGFIEVRGAGSEIRGAFIKAQSINTIQVLGGAEGIFDTRINALIVGPLTIEESIIGQITVGGAGIHNTIISANRDIGRITIQRGGTIEDSEIFCGIHIGTITADEINRTNINAFDQIDRVTTTGDIFDLVLEAGELGTLSSRGDILGSGIFVAGPVAMIQSRGDLISTIEVTGPYGDLRAIKAGGNIGTPVGGIIIVDGKVGTISAGGDFQAELLLNWDPAPVGPGNPLGPHAKYDRAGIELKSLKAGGQVLGLGDIGGDVGSIISGGEFGNPGSEFGIHGDLGKLTIGSGRTPGDLESSVSVDGDFGIAKVMGSVNGQIEVTEDFRSLMLKGIGDDRADLNASITVGEDFGKLTIINGDIALTDVVDGGPVTIDVAGTGPQIVIRGSDISGTIIIGGGEGIDIDGSITGSGRYISTGNIGTLHISGNIEAGGVLDITGDLEKLIVDGSIFGTVHVTGNIGSIQAANILDDESLVTAGGDIRSLDVSGLMRNTYVLAGFDPGEVFDDNDDLIDRSTLIINGEALEGDILTGKVDTLDNSVIAAGVSPGPNTIFGDQDGSDTPGEGLSTIRRMSIGQIIGQGSPFGVFADAQIVSLRIEGMRFPTPISMVSGFNSWTISEQLPDLVGGIIIQQGLPYRGIINGNKVTVVLSGPGEGEVLPGADQIETIQLRNTSGKTKLKVMAAGGATIDVGQLYNGDDESMGTVFVDGWIGNQTNDAYMDINGDVGFMNLRGVASGSEVVVGGDVTKAILGEMNGTDALPTNIDILGDVKLLQSTQVSEQVNISAANVTKALFRGDMDGMLYCSDSLLSYAQVTGDLGGVLSSEGDIDRVIVKGMTGGEGLREVMGIRAGGNIGTFQSSSMRLSVVAAGGNLELAQINGNMEFSTLAAGLDIGPSGKLFDFDSTAADDPDRDRALSGIIDKVIINGDFVESNVVAALAPGQDEMFGTGDDLLEQKNIEFLNPPQVSNVFFDATDLNAITVEFSHEQTDVIGVIREVDIRGDVSGSIFSQDSFVIGAAGMVGKVSVGREAFVGQGNVSLLEVNSKDVDGATLEVSDITAANALSQAFQIRSIGLDQIFGLNPSSGVSDDIIIGGDDNPLTDPTAWVTFDQGSNSATFHNEDGFAINRWGTNYYQITLVANQITNQQGVSLDGEGNVPSGNGIPGGDFVYYFAVADLGNSIVTAFSPFEEFPENMIWSYTSQMGDNPGFTGDSALDEDDFIRMNDLVAGQTVDVNISQAVGSGGGSGGYTENSSIYLVQLWQIHDDSVAGQTFNVIGTDGVEDMVEDDPDITVSADLVAPELDELAYTGTSYYGYDGIGHKFYNINPLVFSNLELLENDLNDLNSLVASQGAILDLKGLAGHSLDSLWAIADFQPNSGSARQSLVLINKVSEDINNLDPDNRASVTISSNNIGSTFTNISGLAELDGVLYGIDAATNTLVRFNSDPNSAGFGLATAVGSGLGNLGSVDSSLADNLVITGLALNQGGDGLIALHNQPVNETGNLLRDALYTIDPATGAAVLLQEFEFDAERHGLATEPNSGIFVGLPLRNSPAGDTMNITFGNQGPVEHIFAEETTDFSGGNRVISDSSVVALNAGLQEFIDKGYYYGFDIEYAHGEAHGDVEVLIEDIDWLNDTENGFIISAVTDDPDNTTVIFGFGVDGSSVLRVEIDAEHGDGDVRVFFAGTSQIETQYPAELILAGEMLGESSRTDLTPTRDMILPGLDEITISKTILETDYFLELTDELESALAQVLTAELLDDLKNEVLTGEIILDTRIGLIQAGEFDLLNDFNDALVTINYDALGYDSSLETFALISTFSFDTRPIFVDPNPLDPTTETDDDVVLTRTVLSDLVNASVYGTGTTATLTIDDILALEFGSTDENLGIDELFAVVSITIVPVTGNSTTRDSLLSISNIIDPYADLQLSEQDLEFYGFTDIVSLAYGDIPGSSINNGCMYGIDQVTQTLVKIDTRKKVPQINNQLKINPEFGKAAAVGDEMDNLANPGTNIEIIGIDFAPDGSLYGIENVSNNIVEIFTDIRNTEYGSRMELVMPLPAGGEYSDISFDMAAFNTPGFLVRSTSGSPVDDVVQVSINGQASTNHTFGSSSTNLGGLTVSSTIGNSDVTPEGGFYQFNVTYTTGQGDILLEIDDINWVGDASALVDSVQISDSLNGSIETFGDDDISILIHTNHSVPGGGSTDSMTIYFGTTSDLMVLANSQRTLSLVTSWTGTGELNALFEVPEDGDYLLNVSSNLFRNSLDPGYFWVGEVDFLAGGVDSPLGRYNLEVLVFNDGNSDFGSDTTASGLPYSQVYPTNGPVNLEPLDWGNDELVQDEDNPQVYRYNVDLLNNPVSAECYLPVEKVTGTLLEPGQAGSVVISSCLGNLLDVDVYSFRLEEGQRVTVDLDSEVLFGRDDVELYVAIYNGDYEALTTIMDEADDVLATGAAQNADTLYEAQAIFSMPNHESVVIDPAENGMGTYYVVVTGYSLQNFSEVIAYQLTIETTEPEAVETPPSQLVWLAFDGARADYLFKEADMGWGPNVVNRPAFDAEAFELDGMRESLIQAIADRIEEIYRNVGLTEDEIEFVTEKPQAGAVYSTVIFGGTTPMLGLYGLAQKLDRHNEDHTDMAIVLTDEIAFGYLSEMSEDPTERFLETVNALANTGAHELGHILGLEHATEINTAEPANLMGYNYDMTLEEQEFKARNSYRLFAEQQGYELFMRQIGFENEIDLLLRYIGSGTDIGEQN